MRRFAPLGTCGFHLQESGQRCWQLNVSEPRAWPCLSGTAALGRVGLMTVPGNLSSTGWSTKPMGIRMWQENAAKTK